MNAPTPVIQPATEQHLLDTANAPYKIAFATLLAQVAGKTFGVPAALARRIAVYSDNATKQLQLDRQCRAYEKQRRLRVLRPAEDIDHVLLNKAAIVLPSIPLTGTMHRASSSFSFIGVESSLEPK